MTRLNPQSDPPFSPRQTLPTMYDLLSENPEEPGLSDEFHFLQSSLLLFTFEPANWSSDMVFSACDLNLYYDVRHPGWYKRPDWFGIVGVSRLYDQRDLRLNYVIWQEQVSPFVVVELSSPGTTEEELGQVRNQLEKPPTKWQVYEQYLRVPYYIVFNRYTNDFQAFRLVGGHYEPAQLQEGRLLMPELELSIGIWQGSYRNINRAWLRWRNTSGNLILTPDERAEKLALRLNELGVDIDKV